MGPWCFGLQDCPQLWAGAGRERSRDQLSCSPALPDIRGYTSPRGQGAGSSIGMSVTRAPLLYNACRSQDNPAPHPMLGIPHDSPGWQWHSRAVSTKDAQAGQHPQRGKGQLERGEDGLVVSTCPRAPSGMARVEGSRVPGGWLGLWQEKGRGTTCLKRVPRRGHKRMRRAWMVLGCGGELGQPRLQEQGEAP